MGFYVGRLAASSARKFKLRLYSRSKGTDDTDDPRTTAGGSRGERDSNDSEDEEDEEDDYEEVSGYGSNDFSQSNCAFNYTPIPLSLHSDIFSYTWVPFLSQRTIRTTTPV
ncbi:hypothetical protein FRC06_007818 [Ceratobasidium sp. 370]|nr:hypothetical protein FRC06_007818 [Ceratobasidium sp. 370]